MYLGDMGGKRFWEVTRYHSALAENSGWSFTLRSQLLQKGWNVSLTICFLFRAKDKPFSFPTYFQRKNKTQKLALSMTSGINIWRKRSRSRKVTPDEAESLIGLDFDATSQLPSFRLRGISISTTCTPLVMTECLLLSSPCQCVFFLAGCA